MSGLLAWASHCAASWLAAVILPRFYSVPESSPCILGGGRGVGGVSLGGWSVHPRVFLVQGRLMAGRGWWR